MSFCDPVDRRKIIAGLIFVFGLFASTLGIVYSDAVIACSGGINLGLSLCLYLKERD